MDRSDTRPPLTFDVEGLVPPKKDGANSMWNSAKSRPLVIALRRKAALAMEGREPYDEPVALTLRVRTGISESDDLWARRGRGDLDNFITGVCDGLRVQPLNA